MVIFPVISSMHWEKVYGVEHYALLIMKPADGLVETLRTHLLNDRTTRWLHTYLIIGPGNQQHAR